MRKCRLLAPWALLGSLLLTGCRAGQKAEPLQPPARPAPTAAVSPRPATVEPVSGAELLCLVKDEAEAKAIAEQYGIELVRFRYGLASFHTEEDPYAVQQKGKQNGWPELSINHRADPYAEPKNGSAG